MFVPKSPSQANKLTNSLTSGFFVFLILLKKKVIELTSCYRNISMLDMFTFDVFLVCSSLGQSVTGIALFIFCVIHQENSIS